MLPYVPPRAARRRGRAAASVAVAVLSMIAPQSRVAAQPSVTKRPRDCGGLEYLADACGRKAMPSNRDRDWTCPNVATNADTAVPRPTRYLPAEAPVEVDASSLRDLVPSELRVTLILVRRVNGRPLYRYLSNGTHDIAEQPWSSTKFMAVANAARSLRAASAASAGLDASVHGIPLGDLITTIHNYDQRRFSSNGLAAYFHDIGRRDKANDLVHLWLGRSRAESYGGNYGMPSPDLGYAFLGPDGAPFSVRPQRGTAPINRLSPLTMAEFLKRLVMHREDASTRLPGLEWSDLRVLFYGAESSTLYPGQWGGMSADPAIYVQSAVDIAEIEARSRGRFRVFSKLGLGDGQFVENQYACFPVLDDGGRPIADRGTELFLSTRLASGRRSWSQTDAALAAYTKTIIAAVMTRALE